ncbi:MAG: extracellular solute-binding protein [Alphaproteobacteria bacterium]
MKLNKLAASLAVAVAAAVVMAPAAPQAAELPEATKKILAKLKLDASILKGLDKEMNPPKAWIDGAKKEGRVKIGGTWDPDQFRKMAAPFVERYPFVKITYNRATRMDRVNKPLMAFRAGRYLTDVISGIGAQFPLFKELNAIVDLRVLPNWGNVPDGMKHPEGLWVGQRLRYWCLSYNTKLVKKSELPKTWDALVDDPRWHNQKIGLGNRPNLWLVMLWGIKGSEWGGNYINKMFAVTKPQLRKEGMNAMIGLAIAGEFEIALPSAAYRVIQMVDKGAPIGWHCPEPVPLAVSELAVMRGNPHMNASLLFVDWFMSKEGQIAQYAANKAPPVHRELQTQNFLAFPDQILGKKIAFRSPELMERTMVKVFKVWDPAWQRGLGISYKTVKVKITKTKRKGRRISFKVGGKTHTVKVSGSRTQVLINGQDNDRSNIKVGMTCMVTYPGNKEEARKFSCK